MKSVNLDVTGQKSPVSSTKWQGKKKRSGNPKIERLKRNQPTIKYGPYLDPDANKLYLKYVRQLQYLNRLHIL